MQMTTTTSIATVRRRARAEPELGEVGHGVGAGAAQRRRDEQQQPEIAGGESDRIPQRVGAVLGDSPATPRNEAAERYSPDIAAAFQRATDRARGHQEVGRGARAAAPP